MASTSNEIWLRDLNVRASDKLQATCPTLRNRSFEISGATWCSLEIALDFRHCNFLSNSKEPPTAWFSTTRQFWKHVVPSQDGILAVESWDIQPSSGNWRHPSAKSGDFLVASFDQAWGRLKDGLFLLLKMIGDADETPFVGELARKRSLNKWQLRLYVKGIIIA
eukprot:s327_g12.t1